MPLSRIDPYLSKSFRVEIEGTTASSFTEVTGLDAAIDIVEYREGTDYPNDVRKLPGITKFSNITLKRGITQNQDLWTWAQNNMIGDLDRRSVSIVLQDQSHNDVLRWNLTNAWPCRYGGPSLHAESSEVAIESIEVCYERLEIAQVT